MFPENKKNEIETQKILNEIENYIKWKKVQKYMNVKWKFGLTKSMCKMYKSVINIFNHLVTIKTKIK